MNKCVVENCNNVTGVAFPVDNEERSKWIDSLQLNINYNENSIVCLDHFREYKLNHNSDKCDHEGKLKQHTVPYLKNDVFKLESESDSNEEDAGNACRLCTTQDDLKKSIYECINNETIVSMIMFCCHPIVIKRNDGLPNMICSTCIEQLTTLYDFRHKCLEVDALWHNKRTSINKRKVNNDIGTTLKKKCMDSALCEITNDEVSTNENYEPMNFRNTQIEIKKNRVPISEMLFSNEPPPLVLIDRNGKPDTKITVQIDGEKAIEKDSTSISIKNEFGVSAAEKQDEMPKHDSKISPIPKGITIVKQKKFKSNTGIHSCILTHGLQESIFVMADKYLFTFGLLKGNIRYLRCVLPNCKAKAQQKLLDNNTYEDKIKVKVPHSHRPPSDQLRKKHMFFHVMRKRMQHDKTLNIRSIYEQVCTQEPEIRQLVPLRNVINEICKQQVSNKLPRISSFEEFYEKIEDKCYEKLHFTNSNKQFYQERFHTEDGCMAVVFCNTEVIESISQSTLMYVDASFKIDTFEGFKYQLVTVLVWTDNSYYPILFALVNKRTQEIFRKIFEHLHDVLAPNLRPHEIVTDYEANLYYSLGETYLESHIGGSVFYYTQNLYKKICSLNLSRHLETNSNFRNLYHMMLMLPLLPVNTISDGLNNIELQAKEVRLSKLTKPIFDHIRSQWLSNVTAEMFCVHRLENRINENVIAPFKKLRDYLLLFKGKVNQTQITIGQVVEKLIELESFLHDVYNKSDKKSFGRDLSSYQKKSVMRAWQYIETHPKININNFFQKVLGYIKCMENQLWIWGFYRYTGDNGDILISAANSLSYSESCSLVEVVQEQEDEEIGTEEATTEYIDEECQDSTLTEEIESNPTIVMEAVIDNDGEVVLQSNNMLHNSKFEKAFIKYITYD